jgi:hypothetical protein
LGVLTKRGADRGNVHSEVDFFHESVWPELFQEFVIREHASLAAHQTKKGFKGLRSERNNGSIARQDAVGRIQEERAEFVEMFFDQ